MLFFNIKTDALTHSKAIAHDCDGIKEVNYTSKVKSLHFGLLPLFPFYISQNAQDLSNHQVQAAPKYAFNAQILWLLSQKFIGLVLFIICLSWWWQNFQAQAKHELSIANNPRVNDFFFLDLSKYLNEEYYQKRVLAAKVVEVTDTDISWVLSRYNFSRERDLVISARSDNFVQSGYFHRDVETLTKETVRSLFEQGVIYQALRPKSDKLFGGFVIKPSKPKTQYTGFSVNADNNTGIMLYQSRDFEAALAAFIQAAEQGDAWGQFNLAEMYLAGEGTKVDEEQAIYWLSQAAKQGNVKAKKRLHQLCQQQQQCK